MFRFHRNSTVVVDNRLRRMLSELSGNDQFIDMLQFRVSKQIDAPCVAVINARCIYLPESWLEFSDDELTASVMHEVGHLTRGDARWRLLAQIATACQVFHPLSHGLLRQLVFGQELSADRWAADAIGPARFVRGISQLALRLDKTALPRRTQGIGMSHSSSFLIRRIKMLRNGMPAFKKSNYGLLTKSVTLLIVAATVVSASWSLSAEEPVRVAVRITNKSKEQQSKQQKELWDILPGRTGYWRVNVDAAMKHPVIGQWLDQADTLFLTPGWLMVVKNEAKGRRADLGLSLTHVENISGSVNMKTKLIDKEETGHDFHTTATAHEFVLRMRRDVDWAAVADALPEERFDAALRGQIGPNFSEEPAQKFIEQDFFATLFVGQTDPRQLIVRNDSKEEKADEKPSLTVPEIRSLWNDHGGELASMIIRLPSLSGESETHLHKLAQTLDERAEYYIVGIDGSEEPGKVRLRLGMTPRDGTSAKELSETISAMLQALVDQAKEEAAAGDGIDESEAAIMRFVEQATPEIRKSSDPSLPSAVIVEGDLIPSALWWVITG
jgi:hypothetical protein